ncbi:extracellular tyrosine-protein kinase PKDCC-like [Mya arenaria]|uniref:extracellular tyrosine-protein kinase PKDCC-like n=1 Tax=Mya arenaria TaxID=6604 RepID=UPI0022DF208C|nr:extracellular tyrosine-protein kinase PKDCC-like [Mya arenaria]
MIQKTRVLMKTFVILLVLWAVLFVTNTFNDINIHTKRKLVCDDFAYRSFHGTYNNTSVQTSKRQETPTIKNLDMLENVEPPELAYDHNANHKTQSDYQNIRQHANGNVSFSEMTNYAINCSNINEVKVKKLVGRGMDKVAFLGMYKVQHVVVKTIVKEIDNSCIKLFEDYEHRSVVEMADAVRSGCKNQSMQQFLLEIIYHTVIKSESIAQMFGFCLHRVPDTLTPKLLRNLNFVGQPTLASITEYGNTTNIDRLQAMSLKRRLQVSRDLAPLLVQTNYTSIGPITLIDFEPKHFLFVNGRMKVFDLGLYYHGHPPCGPQSNNSFKYWHTEHSVSNNTCLYNIPCTDGTCNGLHYVINSRLMSQGLS